LRQPIVQSLDDDDKANAMYFPVMDEFSPKARRPFAARRRSPPLADAADSTAAPPALSGALCPSGCTAPRCE
jgi:hypothetical protein